MSETNIRPAEERLFLCEALNRLLNKGVVLVGDVTISLANVDLIWIGLRLVVTSVETARRSALGGVGIDTLCRDMASVGAGLAPAHCVRRGDAVHQTDDRLP